MLEKEVSGESYDMYISFNAHAAVTPSGSRTTTVEQVLTDGIYDLKDGWTCEEYTLPTGDIAVIPLVRRRRREQSQRKYRLFCK